MTATPVVRPPDYESATYPDSNFGHLDGWPYPGRSISDPSGFVLAEGGVPREDEAGRTLGRITPGVAPQMTLRLWLRQDLGTPAAPDSARTNWDTSSLWTDTQSGTALSIPPPTHEPNPATGNDSLYQEVVVPFTVTGLNPAYTHVYLTTREARDNSDGSITWLDEPSQQYLDDAFGPDRVAIPVYHQSTYTQTYPGDTTGGTPMAVGLAYWLVFGVWQGSQAIEQERLRRWLQRNDGARWNAAQGSTSAQTGRRWGGPARYL